MAGAAAHAQAPAITNGIAARCAGRLRHVGGILPFPESAGNLQYLCQHQAIDSRPCITLVWFKHIRPIVCKFSRFCQNHIPVVHRADHGFKHHAALPTLVRDLLGSIRTLRNAARAVAQPLLPSDTDTMTPKTRVVMLAALPSPAAGDVQSALHPQGEQASRIAEISWVMFTGATLIFLLVMAMLALALYGPPRVRALFGRRALIVGAGIVFPVVVLSALLVYTLSAASVLTRPGALPAARVEVVGEMWWWRVRYLDAQGRPMFETANDIRIPAGQTVEFLLRSDNVIHSFWVPNLAGKIDMLPGHVNRLRVRAQAPGLFRGQCAEYCGAQHAKMMFHVEVLAPPEFQAWLTQQREPAREPDDPRLLVGKQYFMHACAKCHAVRGTEAAGTLGPDLTHVGSRHSLAAGVLPNNVGTLAGWIAGSQHIKPDNKMPSFNQLSGEGLRAVAHYMESLK